MAILATKSKKKDVPATTAAPAKFNPVLQVKFNNKTKDLYEKICKNASDLGLTEVAYLRYLASLA